jgi:serine phosphatase RsbU (regulator of sigma subunit)
MRTLNLLHTHPYPELDYHAFCQCAHENTGNFYDFIPLEGSRLAISFGDLPATAEASSFSIPFMQSLVRGLTAANHGNLADLAGELNRTLYLLGPRNWCAPWFYGLVDPVRHELAYVNAGHEPPLLIRGRDGRVERLERTGAALGLSVRAAQHQRTLSADPGDILVVFSDLLSEAAVLDVVRRNAHAGASQLAMRVWEASAWKAGGDRTFAAIRIIGAGRQPLPSEREVELHALCAA